MSSGPRFALPSVLVLLACGASADPVVGATAGGVASVGARRIDESMVEALARARQLPAAQAVSLLVEDALLAEHFASRHPRAAAAARRSALGRSLLMELRREAEAQGPPQPSEVEAITAERWWALARPPMVEVAHAVVLTPDGSAEAERVAQAIRSQLAAPAGAAELEAAAAAVRGGTELEVRVEALAPVAPDGRAIRPDRPPPAGPAQQQYAEDFARAAHQLERVGSVSPVVRTRFGYHVLVATRLWEARQPTLEQRTAELSGEIYDHRARAAAEALLARLRERWPVQQDRAALTRMAEASRPW